MIDLVLSTMNSSPPDEKKRDFKRRAFLAVLDEEESAGRLEKPLIEGIRQEVLNRMH